MLCLVELLEGRFGWGWYANWARGIVIARRRLPAIKDGLHRSVVLLG